MATKIANNGRVMPYLQCYRNVPILSLSLSKRAIPSHGSSSEIPSRWRPMLQDRESDYGKVNKEMLWTTNQRITETLFNFVRSKLRKLAVAEKKCIRQFRTIKINTGRHFLISTHKLNVVYTETCIILRNTAGIIETAIRNWIHQHRNDSGSTMRNSQLDKINVAMQIP